MSILDRAHTVAPAGYNRWLVPPAALAVEETGRSVFGDKAVKNIFACEHVTQSMKAVNSVGVISEDPSLLR